LSFIIVWIFLDYESALCYVDQGLTATSTRKRKDVPHMVLALRKQQTYVFMLLALITALILSFVIYAAVAHIDVWQMLTSFGFSPNLQYPRG
jgi:hypothetical protein